MTGRPNRAGGRRTISHRFAVAPAWAQSQVLKNTRRHPPCDINVNDAWATVRGPRQWQSPAGCWSWPGSRSACPAHSLWWVPVVPLLKIGAFGSLNTQQSPLILPNRRLGLGLRSLARGRRHQVGVLPDVVAPSPLRQLLYVSRSQPRRRPRCRHRADTSSRAANKHRGDISQVIDF